MQKTNLINNDKLIYAQLTTNKIRFTAVIMHVGQLPPVSQDVKWI